ncbi:alpha/beta hydrolase [Stakelama saccharophila]|uniref:Alpha/beta hydrolase n=1 Tax=Stakelama saccharophila TaxID=3075605 RepID=A0ABZ0B9V1_9SPHN|nr:alpha/beta hydrolase [Stakelama sp. W311]WNO53094.1 alpha/beta hydrolase [Stakelama sp. W311]
MPRRLSLLFGILVLAGCSPQPAGTQADRERAADRAQPSGSESVAAGAAAGRAEMLTAADGERVFATYYAADDPKAIILLFHQAGASRAEYDTIAPRLVRAGYSALAIDQRSGGAMFGANRTVRARGGSVDAYLQTMPDLEAAFAWAQARKLPVVLWGSSYSASLIFVLAARHPGETAAILSFSPGEYLDDGHAIRDAAAKVTAPSFITAASDPEEIAKARAIFESLPGDDDIFYEPEHGVHGSSTLIAARDPQGAAANWEPVIRFLKTTLG